MVTETVRATRRSWTVGTFKRQIANVMLAFLGVLALVYWARILIFTPADAVIINAIGAAISPVFSALSTMIVGFAGLAYGLDAWAKQISPPSGPKP